VFDRLFPGWIEPGLLGLVVALRTLCNAGLTAALSDATHSRLAAGADGALTAASTVLTVVVVARGDPSNGWWNRGVAAVGAVGLYLFSMPLLGEATVAPSSGASFVSDRERHVPVVAVRRVVGPDPQRLAQRVLAARPAAVRTAQRGDRER
jgi:hypothetical protein